MSSHTTVLPAGAIRVDGATKRFVKYEDTPTLVYGLLRSWRRHRRDRLWAVRDVDLAAQPGESIGIIGRNGSGKTTLMSMLCGVTGPTSGLVRVGGRIAPLISVGVGFHPELTGRENVYVNASILGLSRTEIDHRMAEIVEFAEIAEFLDTPVKFYSSGMYLRLGFSVAAHVQPDVMLIDEVLAVGDMGFQVKCFQHLQKLRASGTTIVMVSHNLPAMEVHCERGIVMEHGRKIFDGKMTDAIMTYHERLAQASPTDAPRLLTGEAAFEPGILSVLSAELTDAAGVGSVTFQGGESATLRITVRANVSVSTPFAHVALVSEQGVLVYGESNLWTPFAALAAGEQRCLTISLPLHLTTGRYAVAYRIGRGSGSAERVNLASDWSWLTSEDRLSMYVHGRRSAKGIADLHAAFDGQQQGTLSELTERQ